MTYWAHFSFKVNISDKDLSQCSPRYIGHELDPFISRSLVTISLNVILLMAGLELDPYHLKNMGGVVIRATLIPCIVEATSVAVLAHYLLSKCISYNIWIWYTYKWVKCIPTSAIANPAKNKFPVCMLKYNTLKTNLYYFQYTYQFILKKI